MLFGEMLEEERRQGQEEGRMQGWRQGQKQGLDQGLEQGKMDILLKLIQERKLNVKSAASIMGMSESEFVKAMKKFQKV